MKVVVEIGFNSFGGLSEMQDCRINTYVKKIVDRVLFRSFVPEFVKTKKHVSTILNQ